MPTWLRLGVEGPCPVQPKHGESASCVFGGRWVAGGATGGEQHAVCCGSAGAVEALGLPTSYGLGVVQLAAVLRQCRPCFAGVHERAHRVFRHQRGLGLAAVARYVAACSERASRGPPASAGEKVGLGIQGEPALPQARRPRAAIRQASGCHRCHEVRRRLQQGRWNASLQDHRLAGGGPKELEGSSCEQVAVVISEGTPLLVA
mmetsp:Transcript_94550/g.267106  ORF Transcript_94550/g.267106 Transcript_94550/m.267106 type:complete len:204 (+) Transcript_94550:461-1072(+)